ncbi:MAG: 2,3-bisphosphoglycerate-independent phosphoglycerate mutase [Candidatus Magasanikbacteria bacterium]
MSFNYRPTALIILDGYGIAPPNETNAVWTANTPFFDALVQQYPTMLLEASGLNVGLPETEVGNSEVGHLTIGSGILMYQSLPRINRAVSTGEFFKLPQLQKVLEKLSQKNAKLHIVGLLGNGGVHASQEHLEALITFAKQTNIWDKTYIHGFLDGRDSAKNSGKQFLELLYKYAKDPKIASLSGRFFGMDRNTNWNRTGKAYNAIVNGHAEKMHTDPMKALEESYANNIFDEKFEPVVFGENGGPMATVEDGDVILFFNFRADRARQLTQAFSLPDFKEFERKPLQDVYITTFTEYEKNLPVDVMYPTELVKNPIAKVFSDLNLKQLHIAETEKYAHVTFFLNGRMEDKFVGEERILVPSPAVTNYAESPNMSAVQVTNEAIKALQTDTHDFIVINYANADMVGHTGNLEAAKQSIETADACLAKLVPEIVKKGGMCFIVADHGNAEEMVNLATGEVDKEHNSYPVPFVIVANHLAGQKNPDIFSNDISTLTPVGILSDVAPTLLKTIGITPPTDMTGTCLL